MGDAAPFGVGRRTWITVAVIGVVAAACGLKPVVEGDGVGYFAYLHSLFVDHDLNFANEYGAALAAHVSVWPSLVQSKTSTGLFANYFPVGPALLSSPLYAVALILRPSGQPQFGPPFTDAFALASFFYGLMALVLSYRLAGRVTASAPAALQGAVAVFGTTPLLFYLLYEPSYSHTFSAFTVSAFVYAWWSTRRDRSRAGWLGLGLLGGLMALTRFQDGPLVLIALLDVPRSRWRALLGVPGVVAGFAPQLAVDRVLFGAWLPQRPTGQDLAFASGHYLEVLFSSRHGLFTWAPFLFAAVAGYAFVRDRALRAVCLFALSVEVIIVGAAPDWWGGAAFGARRFIDLTPFAVIGFAGLFARIGPRLSWTAVTTFSVWNLVLVANFAYVLRTDHDPGYVGLVLGQLPALHYLPRLFVQGAVVRELILWPALRQPFHPGHALALLALEAVCVGAALRAAMWRGRCVARPGLASGRSAVREGLREVIDD